MSVNDASCITDYWWIKVNISDEDSGLKTIDLVAEGQSTQGAEGNTIYYRW